MQQVGCRPKSFSARPAFARTRPSLRRRVTVNTTSKLVLYPTGSGSCDHLGAKVPLPAPIVLNTGVFEVGRQAPADIVIAVPTVSSRHALVRVDGDKVSVTDLNSTNGTSINGKDLTPMVAMDLAVGSQIIFGDGFLARFQLQEAAETASEDPVDAKADTAPAAAP